MDYLYIEAIYRGAYSAVYKRIYIERLYIGPLYGLFIHRSYLKGTYSAADRRFSIDRLYIGALYRP